MTPTAQQVSWNNSLGIDNSLLYGGRLGMVFGRRIELQGFYLTNQGSNTGIRDLYDRLGVDDPPQNPGLDVRNYGASVVYNFSVGGWTPFVRGGGSILRFDPSGGETSERIALSYGGGLRFGKPGGLRLNLFVDDLRFRVDRRLLLGLPRNGLPVDADVDANKLRSNLTYGAGLTVPFGGGAVTYDDTPQYQLGNVALPVDVFAGRFDFAGSSGLPEQYIVGARTGIDFGPLVGLRAFYWRGTNDNFNRTQGVQGYGGEAQFALNAGPGINPYLIAGAGQIDFTNSYNALSNGAAPTVIPADQTALILGGGAKIPLGARFTLNASARNWLTSRGGRTEDVVDASQLRSNWQYALGVSFGVGGRGNRRKVAEKPKNDTVFVDRESGERLARRDIDPKLERDGELIIERYVITADGDTLRGEDAEKALAKGGNLRVVTDTLRGVRADSALAFAGDRRRFDDRRDGRRDDEKSRDRRESGAAPRAW
ncbi:MAG: hypothetical protein MUF21_15345 [Gemmatimonadaceae bacterium]|nr:hypothetical protein [Gemmatimonadaceae bacterium]